MTIRGDYHMHSLYSGDSKNQLEAIAERALEIGLEEIAITDHGPAHNGYGIRRKDFMNLVEAVDDLRKKYPQLRILLGIEANILGTDGRIDVDDEMRAHLNWINAGYHFGSNLKEDWKIHALNGLAKVFKGLRARACAINTRAMVNAMKHNRIHMITHPGAKAPVDMEAVAKAAAETGTILEINNSHGHLDIDEIKIALRYPVTFGVSSDAHVIEAIGRVQNAIDRAYIAGVPESRIFNVIPGTSKDK